METALKIGYFNFNLVRYGEIQGRIWVCQKMAEPAPPKESFTKCFLSQQSLLNYHFINRSSQWINCNCKIHRKKLCVWATWQGQHCIKLLTTRTAYYVCCTGGGSGRGGVAVPATRLQPGPPAAGDDLAGGGHRLLVPAQPQLEPLDRRQHWRRLVHAVWNDNWQRYWIVFFGVVNPDPGLFHGSGIICFVFRSGWN